MIKRFFFIVASPRSGTTLLERLLNKHSRLFVPPETAFFSLLKEKDLLDQKFNVNSMSSFLRFYLENRSYLNLDKVDGVEQLLLHEANSYSDVFLNLVGLLQEVAGEEKPHTGEKTPHHLRCANYLLKAFPEACILGVVRDGRAVVRSRMTNPTWEHNLVASANIWRSDASLLRNIKSGIHGERVHIIRYEQLISEPETVLKGVCAFLGEEFEPAMLEGDGNVSITYADYYQRPWMVKSTSSIDSSRAAAWVHEYSQSELALVEHIMERELRYLSYEPSAAPCARWRILFMKEWLRHFTCRAYKRMRKLWK